MVKKLVLILLLCMCITSAKELLSVKRINELYHSSYELESKQKYDAAIRVLKPVLDAWPNSYTVNYRISWLAYSAGNYRESLKRGRKALQAISTSLEVRQINVLDHAARENWEKVEEECKIILEADAYNQKAAWWFAKALHKQGKEDRAEKVMRAMLAVFPTSTWYLELLGDILASKKKTQEAIELYGSVYTLDPTAVQVLSKIKALSKKEK